jgi:bifunctional DNase/RNase
VTEVIIYKFLEGVFYAKIICEKDGQTTEIDSRTSDAIAIGVRFSCPIYSVEKVLEEVSNTNSSDELDDQDDEQEEQLELEESGDDNLTFHEYSIEELKKQLKDAIEIEDYELASRLKDEINERTN